MKNINLLSLVLSFICLNAFATVPDKSGDDCKTDEEDTTYDCKVVTNSNIDLSISKETDMVWLQK